jgi:DNA-binding response OmpR family regulator
MSHRFKDSAAKILLIDDSVADLQVLMGMLANRQYRLTVAFDGNDGYRKAMLGKPDLILLDVRMPGMDGFATCRLLKANDATRQIPVIFLTAANDPDERLAGLTLGAVDYLAKPFVSEEEVLARIGIHLDIAKRLGAAQPLPAPPDTGTEDESASTSDRALVKAATSYLAERLADPPSPEALARILGTNEKKLNEAFRAVLALPVFAWVREERMRQARQLLARTTNAVREIGEHLGYPNPANFSTAFRERFGVSPRDFRASLRWRRDEDDAVGDA